MVNGSSASSSRPTARCLVAVIAHLLNYVSHILCFCVFFLLSAGATPTKPGSATLPFFGVEIVLKVRQKQAYRGVLAYLRGKRFRRTLAYVAVGRLIPNHPSAAAIAASAYATTATAAPTTIVATATSIIAGPGGSRCGGQRRLWRHLREEPVAGHCTDHLWRSRPVPGHVHEGGCCRSSVWDLCSRYLMGWRTTTLFSAVDALLAVPSQRGCVPPL